MKLADLRSAGRSPALPLKLELPAGELCLREWLRILPGRRYVARGDWQGRAVVAKLLVGPRAARQFQRESQGARLLAGRDVATPALLAEGFDTGMGGWLLFDYLAEGESLAEAWRRVEQEPPLSAAQQAILDEALAAVATLHAGGLWQSDLHLDNLLRQAGRLWVIDGGGVRAQTPGRPLSADLALRNLGVFFAQLPASLEPYLERLLASYQTVNGQHALSVPGLREEIARVRRWRLTDYLRKLRRDCSLFSVCRAGGDLRVQRREAASLLDALLAEPDSAIAAGKALKLGGTATVARVDVAGRPLVVKRYNIKGVGHWLKRCWRPTRAWHSWVEGNRLLFLGIATPLPLGVLERRRFGLRGRGYLVTEYAGGEDIIARFGPYLDSSPPELELRALDHLFAALLRERISHGDLKGHNLLWQDDRWALIDLDAVRQHRGDVSFRKAYARDRARFLRNWPADSALHRLLDERLPKSCF